MSEPPAIPRRVDEIDLVWVSSVLRAEGHDIRPIAARATPIGTGQMATSVRVEIEYDHHDGTAPNSVVVKLASADPNSRGAGAQGAYLKEVRYYQQLDETVSVNTPRAIWSDIDLETSDFVLVLEDMRPAEQGDQIAGCSPDDALSAAENIAGLHAPRWCDPRLFEHEWLTPPPAQRDQSRRDAQAVMEPMTAAFIDRYRNRITDRHVELLTWFAGHIEAWLADAGPRFGLTHADHRLDNLLFDPHADDRRVTVVDWQTISVRNPVADISYLLGTGLEPDVRRRTERDIVARYHERLGELGVLDYSFAECFDDYRSQSLHALLITVLGSMLTGQTARGDDMFMVMLRRSAQQILDLDVV